ncbi:hypothetical protein UlMin_040832 [Ulmus minor]
MDPIFCAKGCGFFGTAENRNMCSKCYQNFLKEEFIAKYNIQINPPDSNNSQQSFFAELNTKEFDQSRVLENSGDKDGSNLFSAGNSTGVKKRCNSCNKKVGLTGFSCRCGNLFCGLHRLPEAHGCGFDYKRAGRDVLAKQNPTCKGDKLDKI